MCPNGYYANMLTHGMDVMDTFAEDVAGLEELPITVEMPPQVGVKPQTYALKGFFKENPAVQTITSTGIRNSFNGVLYVRRDHTPVDLRRSAEDHSIAVGMKFAVRGRQYRCIKADYGRREYAFTLSDLGEADGG